MLMMLLMSHGARALLSALAVLAASVVPVPAAMAAGTGVRAMPEPPPASLAYTELDELRIAPAGAMTEYSRGKFPHWAGQGASCDTRELVLRRDGVAVISDSECRAVAGVWTSLYDGAILTESSKVDVDHIVPLAEAWRSGADQWDTTKRKRFANDLVNSQLIAVSAASNRAKGDQSPDKWRPSNADSWCVYARAWTDVKYVYELSITRPEKRAIEEMLDTCVER